MIALLITLLPLAVMLAWYTILVLLWPASKLLDYFN